MKRATAALPAALLLWTTLAASGCVYRLERTQVRPADAARLPSESRYLKVHLRDGGLLVLSPWRIEPDRALISGEGRRLAADRRDAIEGTFSVPYDSVALLETNASKIHSSVAALTVFSVASVALTVYCLSNPKACFGSCPTFSVRDGDRWSLRAEGFSASVAPALEASDIDALGRLEADHGELTLRLTNEALETHVIRYARLLAVPRRAGGRAFADAEQGFRRTGPVIEPRAARGREGDCLAALRTQDGVERISLTDSTDLGARETLELEFDADTAGDYGLVIASRQSLLPTYLFYQTLAYLGRSAGTVLARLDASSSRVWEHGVIRELGGIEVWCEAGADSQRIASLIETGPIATDVKIVPLPATPAGPLRIRLRLTRGMWRIDRVGLARLEGCVEPVVIEPFRVLRGGTEDPEALADLVDTSRALVTMPGDALELVYRAPAGRQEYEYFLESRGYYLEWMRETWLAEESPLAAARLVLDPRGSLRELAPRFKRVEADMERTFWGSRYAVP